MLTKGEGDYRVSCSCIFYTGGPHFFKLPKYKAPQRYAAGLLPNADISGLDLPNGEDDVKEPKAPK